MNNLDKLISYFEKFPGIGGRQARRFAFHIMTMPKSNVDELAQLITNLQSSVVECHSCHRFFSNQDGSETMCNICSDSSRDHTKLMVVARDTDIQAIERAGIFDGLYFVLGGTVPLLQEPESKKLRGGALKQLVSHRASEEELAEIICGFAVNPDGENTARYVAQLLKETIAEHSLKLSQLGRGLSTGSELEYADPETIKNAFSNRG